MAALRQIDRRRGPGRDRPRVRPRVRPRPGARRPDAADEAATDDLIRYARRARELGGADVGTGRQDPVAQRRHGGVDRGRGPVRRAARPTRRVPGRWDGTLASGPRRGRGPARRLGETRPRALNAARPARPAISRTWIPSRSTRTRPSSANCPSSLFTLWRACIRPSTRAEPG
jgi:hypothetical protein